MLKVLPDTNNFVSAIGWGGNPYKAISKAFYSPEMEVYVTQLILDELEEVFSQKKLIHLKDAYEEFKKSFLDKFILLPDADIKALDEELIPETKDRIIYRTAVINHLDVLITSDQKFLHSGVKGIELLNPKEFIEKY